LSARRMRGKWPVFSPKILADFCPCSEKERNFFWP
jgi:hypothetical protein